MDRMVAGGTGLIGSHLVRQWLKENISVTVVGRSAEKIIGLFGHSVKAVEWSELTAADLNNQQVIVNLAGANILSQRWSSTFKKELLGSRVTTIKKLIQLLNTLDNPPPLFNASAISIYDHDINTSVVLDENTPVNSSNLKFTQKLCFDVEKEEKISTQAKQRMVFLRLAAVLAPDGGSFPMMKKSFQYCLGGRLGTGQQAFNWIIIDDVLKSIEFLINHPELHGAVNLVAPESITQNECAKTLGKLMHKPSFVPTPAFLLRLVMGEAANLLLDGKVTWPTRLLEAGFSFDYPILATAQQRLLDKTNQRCKVL